MRENVNILVVDDNQENLRVVSNYLREKGFKIALALDGVSALKTLQENKIDLIMLDVMMPNMDGFEVCKRIKEMNEFSEIPIIFLTAKSETDDIVKGFKVGGVDYIVKPFRKEELFVRVNNHIQIKLMRDFLKSKLAESDYYKSVIINKLLNLGIILDVD